MDREERHDREPEPRVDGEEGPLAEGQQAAGRNPGEPADKCAEDRKSEYQRDDDWLSPPGADGWGHGSGRLHQDGDEQRASDEAVDREDPVSARTARLECQQSGAADGEHKYRKHPIEGRHAHQATVCARSRDRRSQSI